MSGGVPSTGFVYFAAPVGGGRIKIGFSSRPASRVVQLSKSSPVMIELLAHVRGNASDERALHYRFRASHSHAEWFDPSAALLGLIADIKVGEMLPPDQAPREEIGRWRSRQFVRKGKWPAEAWI